MNLEELTKQWEETRLLSGIDKDKKTVAAFCLENQRLFNESYNSIELASFRRISIPVVRRLCNDSVLFKNNVVTGDLTEIPNRFYNFKLNWEFKPESYIFNLSAEAELTAVLSKELSEKIDVHLKDQTIVFHHLSYDPAIDMFTLWYNTVE